VDRDSEVHVPVTAAQRLLGTDRIDGLAIRAPDRDTIDQLGASVVATLVKRHPTPTSAP
jgi:putative ABC transport system permease protein